MKIEAGATSELCCNISEVLTFAGSGLGPDKIRPSLIVAAVAASGRRVRLVVVL